MDPDSSDAAASAINTPAVTRVVNRVMTRAATLARSQSSPPNAFDGSSAEAVPSAAASPEPEARGDAGSGAGDADEATAAANVADEVMKLMNHAAFADLFGYLSPELQQLLSPIDFEVLHHSEVQVEYRLSGETSAVSAAILLVNGTEALRTMNRQPSVSLSGLTPGICNLSVRVVGHHGELVADASTLFFISSAAATPNQGDAKEVPPPEHDDEGRWFAIAFGSDDWGWGANSIPVFPSMEELRRARDEGWDPGSWGSASVETRDDIERLFDLIEGLNEGTPAHQRVVLSPYWVVGGPDFRAMAASGCPGAETCAYHERVWSSNDVGPPGAWPFCRGDLRPLVRSGFEAGLWHPQYHGRSHFDTRAWVAYLRNDLVSQRYFARGMVFCNDTMLDNNGHPRTLISEHVREHPLPGVSDNDSAQVLAWLEGGVKTFAQFWGYTPVVASMPHHA
jgi:hypothetical protein